MLLQLKNVNKTYGSVKVIRDLTLSVEKGEFVGVIGPNGAGKTTAFGLIAGHLKSDSGNIQFNDIDVTNLPAERRCHAGIGRTFQIPLPFHGMTVFENALVAANFGSHQRGSHATEVARNALQQCGLENIANRMAGALTLLQRKRLELARALATSPQLLLIDEVGGGLTDSEISELLHLVWKIHQQGVTILWIEHLVHALVQVAHRLVVLTEGSVLADGNPKEVISSKVVQETYLGSELEMQAEVGNVAS